MKLFSQSLIRVHLVVCACFFLSAGVNVHGQLLNQPIDVTPDFADVQNTYFLPGDTTSFDPATGRGVLRWNRSRLGTTMLFNDMVERFDDVGGNEWPRMYAEDPELPFAIDFISDNTVRIRMKTSTASKEPGPSIMLVDEANGGALPVSSAWTSEKVKEGFLFASSAGSILLREKPWGIEVRDADGKMLTRSMADNTFQPFCFIRRPSDYSRSVSAVFSLAPGEKIFGCGESFTELNKRGQKVVLSTTDALSCEKQLMYKPVPFFLSNRGYGMFVHTSAPTTFDIGSGNHGRNVISSVDDELDLFIFIGKPKEVIGAYTAVTGRAAMPPLWSFGLWMSRITYKSESEARDIVSKLREHRIPSDVIHLDTGWFETDWKCDYEFSKSRFDDPEKMIADFAEAGIHTCLWQLPYFVPGNRLFPEIVEKGLAVKDAKGNLPYEDAVLDFSNPETVAWYQDKIAGLLKLGVGAIKTDFGEAAPTCGLYASGTTGIYEHNLYPLRYQEAAADIIRKETGNSIIWARAGWAGAQRNPVHWGGDSHKTFDSMASTLRAGLSIGLSGFSFWSHDIGGFAGPRNDEVFEKWAPFGMLTSHSRVHGNPPKEPWLIGEEFMDSFRRSVELRYKLMPYIYAQAKDCSERGLPMLRAMFVEFPDDPGAWLVDDQYLFGSDLLVAPLFEAGSTSRSVYLPGGKWHDYQTGKVYGSGWQKLEAGSIPAIVLVRDGAVIPHIALAQCTKDLDWSQLNLQVYAAETAEATALVCLPSDQKLQRVSVKKTAGVWRVGNDPFSGRVQWQLQ